MASGFSYNGWAANSDPAAIGINTSFTVLGARFPGGIRSGSVETCFRYLITRLHNEVEPMMTDPNSGAVGYGCWGYSYRANVNNPRTLSCHASGTAIDYNAPLHANGTSTGPFGGGGWTSTEYLKVRNILNEIGVIRWLTSNDPMHFEIQGTQAAVDLAAARLGRDNIPGRPSTPSKPSPAPDPGVPAPPPVEDDEMPRVFYVLGTDGTVWRTSDFVTRTAVENMDRLKDAVWNNQNLQIPGGGKAADLYVLNGTWVDFTHTDQIATKWAQANVDQFGALGK